MRAGFIILHSDYLEQGMTEGKTFKIVGNDISDGFHTFDELYEHRCILYLSLCLANKKRCFIKQDSMNWFILYCETPYGQVSYHLPKKYLEMARRFFHESPDHEFDGHTSNQVIERLTGWMLSGIK